MNQLSRALLALACAVSALAQAPDKVRIGTWNLEFFGNRRDNPRTAEDVAKVGAFVRSLGVDVLAVQEVGTQEAIAQLAADIGPRWQFVLGSTGMFRDGTGGQRVGFLWNDERVELLQAEEFLDLPREVTDPQTTKLALFHRIPVSAVFRARNGGLDFRAVTVHLKADNRRDIEQHKRDEMSTRKRQAEARALGEKLSALLARQGEDQDIVVLGDFNHVFARERTSEQPDEAKLRYDLRVPLLASLPGFHRLAPRKPLPTIRWFPESIDHIVVHTDLRAEAIAPTLTIHSPFQSEPSAAEMDAWQRTYSDHYPVTVDLDASKDQDPTASFVPVPPAHELRRGGWAAAIGAASTPAATTKPTEPVNAGLAPQLVPGARVEVRVMTGGTYSGILLAPLGADWVQIDLDNGSVAAFPTRNVLSVVVK